MTSSWCSQTYRSRQAEDQCLAAALESESRDLDDLMNQEAGDGYVETWMFLQEMVVQGKQYGVAMLYLLKRWCNDRSRLVSLVS